MSVHWHDDEYEWCPCDEADAAFPAPEVKTEAGMIIDWDRRADKWIGSCSECGEICRRDGTIDDHNLIVVQLAQHDERLHGGDGRTHWSAWLQ